VVAQPVATVEQPVTEEQPQVEPAQVEAAQVEPVSQFATREQHVSYILNKINIVIASANLLIVMTDPAYKERIKATKNALLTQPELCEKYAKYNSHTPEDQNRALSLLEMKYKNPESSVPYGLVVLYKDLFLTSNEINMLPQNKKLLNTYVIKMAMLLSSENVFIFEHMIKYSPEFNLDYSEPNAWNVIQERVKTNPDFLAGDDTKTVSLKTVFWNKLDRFTAGVQK